MNDNETPLIKPKAFAVFRRSKEILVNEVREKKSGKLIGYRIPGGHIEFGEKSHAAVLREIQEEIDKEVENVHLLGVLENVFVYNDKPGHEVIFVYAAEFKDKTLYEQNDIMAYEHGSHEHFRLFWLDPDKRPKGTGFWPQGLEDMLAY